ncbi:MAG: hypothetical protein OEV21_02880 [Thermoplasmata archaeon]|nr:hypothetical protein [Thermoplasmata archaeon]
MSEDYRSYSIPNRGDRTLSNIARGSQTALILLGVLIIIPGILLSIELPFLGLPGDYLIGASLTLLGIAICGIALFLNFDPEKIAGKMPNLGSAISKLGTGVSKIGTKIISAGEKIGKIASKLPKWEIRGSRVAWSSISGGVGGSTDAIIRGEDVSSGMIFGMAGGAIGGTSRAFGVMNPLSRYQITIGTLGTVTGEEIATSAIGKTFSRLLGGLVNWYISDNA